MPNILDGKSIVFQDKDTAIEHLMSQNLNDIDGRRTVARYWKDGEGSEIASVESILHRTNGVANIEIKDGEGGGDGECKLKAWTNSAQQHQDPEGENWRYEPFANKYGIYHSVSNLNDGNGTTEGTVLSKNGDTNVYTATYDDGSPMGDRYIYGGGALVVRYKNRDPELSGGEMQEGYFILDPHKHDIMVNSALKFSGMANHYLGKRLVIKQPVKYRAVRGTKYYFQGRGIAFELPRIPVGVTHRFHFEGSERLKLYGGSLTSALRRTRRSSTYSAWQRGDVEITWDGNEQTLTITNNSQYSTSKFSITMENDSRYWKKHFVVEITNPMQGQNEDNEDIFYYFHMDSPEGIHETTSPGFLIENGIIKCYKKSSLKRLLETTILENWDVRHSRISHSFKHIKDGSVFYYSKYNAYIGTSPVFVKESRMFFDAITKFVPGDYQSPYHNNRKTILRPDEGILQFVSPVTKRRQWERTQTPTEQGGDPYICNIFGTYCGVTDNNYSRLAFEIRKEVSTDRVTIRRIGFTYRGTDGNIHQATQWIGESLPAEASSFIRYAPAPTDMSPYEASVRVQFISVRVNVDTEKYMMSGAARTRCTSRTRWHDLIVRHQNPWQYGGEPFWDQRSRFKSRRFHRCRYIEKFKGVPSEFPELFYIR